MTDVMKQITKYNCLAYLTKFICQPLGDLQTEA